MEIRTLGTQGLSVSALGLGCMGMSSAYENRGTVEAVQTIHRAIELGITFFDTAEVYNDNEHLVGQAIWNYRDRVVIATKFGFKIDKSGTIVGLDSSPDNIRRVCDASLQRLGIDYIDLFYQHRVDKTIPIEETVMVMAGLVQQGKIRYLGLSEASPETIRRAHAIHPISALQAEYSLWEREVETRILPTVRECRFLHDVYTIEVVEHNRLQHKVAGVRVLCHLCQYFAEVFIARLCICFLR